MRLGRVLAPLLSVLVLLGLTSTPRTPDLLQVAARVSVLYVYDGAVNNAQMRSPSAATGGTAGMRTNTRSARLVMASSSSIVPIVGAESATAGAGSGPWVGDALAEPTPGGAIGQSSGGACGAACGAMVSGQSQAQLLEKLGEWTNPEALAEALGQQARGFGSGEEALAQAQQGTMIARLQAPGLPGHFVVISPAEDGNFLVQDPWGGGSTYPVSPQWIEQYVSHGVSP